jgi:Transposase
VRDHSEESFSDGTPLPPEELPAGAGKGPSQAQQLMAMAEDTYRLIRSTDGRAYAVPRLGPQIAVPLASRSGNSIRARLAASLHRQTGKVASASALADCITVLDGEASELDPRSVWLRVGQHDDTVVVDMGTETGQCITITPNGWAICTDSPVIFRRSELTHPLVTPEHGGTLDALRALINLSEQDYRLAIAWVVAAYLTGIPHPILLVQGEQGTAKSNLIRTLLALVDPQPAADRTPPRDQREWAIFARASWAFSFDNITDIPPWLSNALCKGVPGDAVLQRVLHSDEDIGVYSFQRVIALTTIAIRHDVAGDLADRILLVEPEVIEVRRTETDITAARAGACHPLTTKGTAMTIVEDRPVITGGVDTRADLHVAAALDPLGGLLGVREFPATATGYAQLLDWLGGFGPVSLVGVEGTGSYGAGRARHLAAAGIRAVEADRADRQDRHRQGKSDPLDAVSAARASGAPQGRDGAVEAIRALMVAKRSARAERTQAVNQARALIVTGPDELRARFAGHTPAQLAGAIAALRPRPGDVPGYATRVALRELGRRAQFLDARLDRLDEPIGPLVTARAPGLPRPARRRPGHRRAAADRRRGSSGAAAQRELAGAPVRCRPDSGLFGQGQPAPAQPRRRPPGQPRAVADRDHPAGIPPGPPGHPRLRRAAHPRRLVEEGDHPLPETLRRA